MVQVDRKRGKLIVIRVNDATKIVSLWCSSDEADTNNLPDDVMKLFSEYRSKKYMIAMFHSGTEDLFDNTLAMLKHNRELSAENEVRQAKLAGK